MAVPVLALIILGAAAVGTVAATSKPNNKKSTSISRAIKKQRGHHQFDPNKLKVVFRLKDGLPMFGIDTLHPFKVGDVLTFMAGQLDQPDEHARNRGDMQRPSASFMGNKSLQDYRITEIEDWESDFSSDKMQAVWRLARIGENPMTPYSWSFYRHHSYATLPGEINYTKGMTPSVAALRVVRDGEVIWEIHQNDH